jgi:putative ABC transport system ATP-binding protein
VPQLPVETIWFNVRGADPTVVGAMVSQGASRTEGHSPPLVEITNVSRIYSTGGERVGGLQSVSACIQLGEFVALMGPSGSGKTTLLNIIGGIDNPSAGVVRVNGEDIHALSDARRTQWRARNVGFIFQLYHLHPAFNAEHNVILPLRLFRMSGRERRQRARTALSLVGLAERIKHRPSQLSGGQQQRVAIARAIVTDPRLLLCDEPTGNLDRQSSDEVLALLRLLNERHGKTIVMVTHDPHAASYAQRTLIMNKGVLSSSPTA